MKKLFFIALVALGFLSINAQNVDFGVTAGYFGPSAKVTMDGISATASESGFYVGGFADISVSDQFHVQPALIYGNVGDGADGLVLPIMAKYYANEKLNIQLGPHFDISTEEVPDDFTGFGISIGAGLGYDINENFFVEGRYSFQLNDYYTGDLDIETTTNTLMIGLGYKF